MNAAMTIFGMGIGVGLILGDSFARGDRSTTTTTTTTTMTPSSRSHTEEQVVLVSSPSSSSCGRGATTTTTILRSTRRIQIQEPPAISLAAANLLPAQ
jgi:hypothetical protein